MLAISQPLFGWPSEDMIMRPGGHNINMNIFGETETSDSLLHSPSSDRQLLTPDQFIHGSPANGEHKKVKKLNHNASERDRRKRINGLYSSLRSLLPQTDQTKKLSIPGTVSRVLKHIPELQKELESLKERKEGLLKKMSKQETSCRLEKQRKTYALRSSSNVSATQLSDTEIMIQISTLQANKGSIAGVLLNLEHDGFVLQDSSSFESFQERVFYNLHLQVEGTQVIIDLQKLKEKLTNLLCEKQEETFRSNFEAN